MNRQDEHEFLLKCSDVYYNTGNKIITDAEYDMRRHNFETTYKTKLGIGAKVNVKNIANVRHNYLNLAGTLDKVNSIEELKKWLKDKGVTDGTKLIFSIKIDGHALVLEYEDSILQLAVTRGDEGKGKDLTEYFSNAILSSGKSIKNVDLNELLIDPIDSFGIACETCISFDNFNKLLEENPKLTYSNPRSSIGGILTEDGFALSKYLSLSPLKIKTDMQVDMSRNEQITLIKELSKFGFNTIPFETGTLADIEELYEKLSKHKDSLELMVDGIVVEIANDNLRNKLSYSGNIPNFAVALKFPYTEVNTKLINVEWFTEGTSGRYTPVAYFEPVKLIGNTYQKVSLANYARFKSMKLRKDDDLIFELRNEVLGYISKSSSDFNLFNEGFLFKAPTKCVKCDAKLKNDKTFITCINPDCSLNRIGRIVNFLDKNKVKGIKSNIVEALIDNEIVTDISSLFTIDYKKLSEIEGFGVSSADNIKTAITELKDNLFDYSILGGLNITNFSMSRAKDLCKHFTIDEIFNMIDQDTFKPAIKKLAGFDTILADIIHDGILLNIDEIFNLTDSLTIKDSKSAIKTPTGKTFSFVITGELHTFDTREELIEMLVSLGHSVRGSVTSKTDYLVTNDTNSGTVKNKEAKRLNKPIITESELITLLDLKV